MNIKYTVSFALFRYYITKRHYCKKRFKFIVCKWSVYINKSLSFKRCVFDIILNSSHAVTRSIRLQFFCSRLLAIIRFTLLDFARVFINKPSTCTKKYHNTNKIKELSKKLFNLIKMIMAFLSSPMATYRVRIVWYIWFIHIKTNL